MSGKADDEHSPRSGSPSSSSSSSSSDDPAITAVKQIIAQKSSKFNWMPAPSDGDSSPDCPPGLEHLSQLSKLFVHQQIDLSELVTHQEKENTYRIQNEQGQDVYFAAEKSTELSRQYSGSGREFSIALLDSSQKEVLRMEHPAVSCPSYCCASCSTQEIEVQAPVGRVVGHVRQDPSGILYPWFSLLDSEEQVVFKIKGPFLGCHCLEAEFEVFSAEGNEGVGMIKKMWGGEAKEQYTDAESFEIQFPKDVTEVIKAVMIGATFLIDFTFFERSAHVNPQNEEQEQSQ